MNDATAERFERTHTASLRTLVQYAGASGDFYEMHYDLPFAHERGHAELSVHGLLKAAWLGQLVDDWFEGRGRVVSFEVSYRGMDFRDQPVTCGGEVTRREGSTRRARAVDEERRRRHHDDRCRRDRARRPLRE